MRTRTVLSVVVVVLAAAVVSSVLRFDASVDGYADQEDVRDNFFSSPALSRAPSSCDASTGEYVFGRTLRPAFSMDLCACGALQRALQQKEFVWAGAAAGPWLAGVAVLQLQYVSVVTAQFFHSGTGESWRVQARAPPLPKWPFGRVGAHFGPNNDDDDPNNNDNSSDNSSGSGSNGPMGFGPAVPGHCVSFAPAIGQWPVAALRFSKSRLRMDFSGVARRSADGAQRRVDLSVDALVPDAFVGFVFPIGPRRAAVVAKFAAAPLKSPLRLRIGDERFESGGSLALDYTRGLLRRRTKWHWACAPHAAGAYGFHLSAGTYDIGNRSVESAVFANGTVALLDAAIVFTQRAPGEWSVAGGGVDLRFSKRDAHDGEVRLGIISAKLDHAWGFFDGTISTNGVTYTFDKVAGVLEDHDAYW